MAEQNHQYQISRVDNGQTWNFVGNLAQLMGALDLTADPSREDISNTTEDDATTPGPPPSSGQKRFPGFDFVHPIQDSQQPVVSDGYPWVQTNSLIPSWGAFTDRAPPPEAVPSLPIDRLNRHSHHGLNTHLILSGDLTLEKAMYTHEEPDQEQEQREHPIEKVELSADGPLREAPVGPGDIYLGTTETGCQFVEGHRCLSPTTALRFIDRGTLCWHNKKGQAAPWTEQKFINKQLRSHPKFGKLDGALVFEVPNTSLLRRPDRKRLAQELKKWFQAEWTGGDLDRMPSLSEE